ncbi:hypothetical protein D9M71_753230 [compost metagenome]
MFHHQPKRHPSNTNLKLHYSNEYRGFAVQQLAHGSLIENYLEPGLETLLRCLSEQAHEVS